MKAASLTSPALWQAGGRGPCRPASVCCISIYPKCDKRLPSSSMLLPNDTCCGRATRTDGVDSAGSRCKCGLRTVPMHASPASKGSPRNGKEIVTRERQEAADSSESAASCICAGPVASSGRTRECGRQRQPVVCPYSTPASFHHSTISALRGEGPVQGSAMIASTSSISRGTRLIHSAPPGPTM